MNDKIINFLRWSQKYTKTDMAYVVTGGFWWIFGKGGIIFIGFATMAAFANWLPKENYGTYQFVVAIISLLAIFALPTLNNVIVKSIAQKKDGTLRAAVKEKIKWGVIGSFLSLALAGWYFFQGNNLLAAAFLISALFIPFKETFTIFIHFWLGRKKFGLQAKYNLIAAGLSALFLVAVIYLSDNVLIIVTAFLLGQTLFHWLFYKKTLKSVTNNDQDRGAISFGKKLTLVSAIETATLHIDKVIVWKFLGAVPLAVYSFAQLPIQKIKDALPIVPLALPKLGQSKIDDNKKRAIISKFLRLFVFTVPAAITLVLIAPLTYSLFFPQYTESVIYFQALCGIIAISPFFLFIAALMVELKKALYIVNMGAPLIKIILFLALVPHFGLWGVVIAILAGELLRGLLAFYFFLRM